MESTRPVVASLADNFPPAYAPCAKTHRPPGRGGDRNGRVGRFLDLDYRKRRSKLVEGVLYPTTGRSVGRWQRNPWLVRPATTNRRQAGGPRRLNSSPPRHVLKEPLIV